MIRPDTRMELIAYREGKHPYPFGSFVTAVLANDLVGAFNKADEANAATMQDYASFLYNEMPGRRGNPKVDIWGSYEAVENEIQRQIDSLPDYDAPLSSMDDL